MNLVMMVLDTLRYDVVHHRGITHVHTPNLDALRRDSVSFSAAFGEGEPTIPVRRALMTGIRSYPWRYEYDTEGVWPRIQGWHKIPPEQPTIAEILVERGYKTALIGDVYHIFKPTMNFTRGWVNWEFVRGQESDNWQGGKLDSIRAEAERCVKGPFTPQEQAVLIQYLLNKRAFAQMDGLTSGTVFRRGIEWLEANHDDGPFALWLEAFDPHEPWDPPRDYADRYCPDFEGTEFILPPAAAQVGTELEKERTKALYYGEITYMDEWIGRLLDTLATLGRLEDTVVMFTSDHGTELLDHDRFGKSAPALHPYTTQLNWLVRHPSRVAGGQELTTFVQGHDILPTALDMLDVAEPDRDDTAAALAGRSLWPLIRAAGGEAVPGAAVEAAQSGRDHVITGWGPYASVRDQQWNYIVDCERPDEDTRLFDVVTDPGEHRNLAADHPAVVRECRRRLENLLGRDLPTTFPSQYVAGDAPARLYYGSRAPQADQEAGFV